MSTVRANSFTDVTGGSNAVLSGIANPTGSMGFRNRIINGDMRIDQRNSGGAVTPTAGTYTVDRWEFYITQASKVTFQQNAGSVTPPAGFTNYLGFTVGAAANVTVGAADLFLVDQYIEGYNVTDLGWGAAGAKAVTLTFWVRSSLTGTFGGALTNSGNTRSYPFTYTISAANTWEQKVLNIAGDTSGTWNTTNGTGLGVRLSIGTGSTYLGAAGSWAGAGYFGATGQTQLVQTNSATFYVTGVQLQAGTFTSAPEFERLDYGRQLIQCQRYFERLDNGNGVIRNSTVAFGQYSYKVEKRATPVITITGTANVYVNNNGDALVTAFSVDKSNTTGFRALFTSSGMTAGYGAYFDLQNGSQSILSSAEL